jgi:hypothetical protein
MSNCYKKRLAPHRYGVFKNSLYLLLLLLVVRAFLNLLPTSSRAIAELEAV